MSMTSIQKSKNSLGSPEKVYSGNSDDENSVPISFRRFRRDEIQRGWERNEMKSRRFPIFILRDRDMSSQGMDNGEVDVVIAPLIVLKSLDSCDATARC